MSAIDISTMSGKSMFGSQAPSTRRSAPSHGFGSSNRNHASKLYMGPEHAKTSSVPASPGPCYEVEGACQSQANSGKTSPPQWQFGTAERFSTSPRRRTPGPGQYNQSRSFGRQVLSQRDSNPLYGFGSSDRHNVAKVYISPAHNAPMYGSQSPGPAAMYKRPNAFAGPKYGFGTDGRFNSVGRQLNAAAAMPGPGAYTSGSTFSTSASSRLNTPASFGFGSANREHVSRVFVSEMQAKASGITTRGSPGPAVYSLGSSLGAQATSRGHSAPSWGFGRSSRFNNRAYESDTPGPGSYSL